MKTLLLLASLCFVLSTPLFSFSPDHVYTLYRNTEGDSAGRVHVATFDVSDHDQYNDENCQAAQAIYEQQPGVKTRFWCEEGKFRKRPR